MRNEYNKASGNSIDYLREPLTESEAAVRLGLKVATLRAWRHQGRGPAFVRLGRAIRYLPDDIDDFLQTNRQQPLHVNNSPTILTE